jgi:hypothetical protein
MIASCSAWWHGALNCSASFQDKIKQQRKKERTCLCSREHVRVLLQEHGGPHGDVAGRLVAGVEVHDEHVDDLVVVQAPPALVLGLDQPVHHVHSSARDPLGPGGAALVQHALQHGHEAAARAQRPAVREAGQVDGHGAHAVVELRVAALQRARGGLVRAAQEDLHDDLERHAPQLRQELDAAAVVRPRAQRRRDGAVDEGQVPRQRVEAVDGRGRQLADAPVLVVRHRHERPRPDQRNRRLGPPRHERVVVHQHLLAPLRRRHQHRRAAEHEASVHARATEPAINGASRSDRWFGCLACLSDCSSV